MAWMLIFWITGGGTAIGTVPFGTENACLQALEQIKSRAIPMRNPNDGICVETKQRV